MEAIKSVKKWMNSPMGVTVAGVVTMIMSIVSIVGVVQAFNKLDARTDDVRNIVNNWERQPFVEVSIHTTCPDGWDDVSSITWPGTEPGPCACPANAKKGDQTFTSTSGSCSSNATDAGCRTFPATTSLRLDDFVGTQRICALRGGPASISTSNGFKERPFPTGPGECPSGYVACGKGTYNDGATTCVPSGDKCPLTKIKFMTASEYHSSDWDGKVDFSDPNYVVAYATETFDDLPLVDATVGFGQVCIGDSSAVGFEEGDGNVDGTIYFGSSCSKGLRDDRYDPWGSRDLHIMFDAAADAYCSQSGANSIPISFSQCDGTTICTQLNGRSLCEQAQSYVPAANAKNLDLFHRTEIQWNSTCTTSREDVVKYASPLEDARDRQRSLMTVNIISNLFAGFLIPILLIYNAWAGDVPCVPKEGEAEKRIINIFKVWGSLFFRILKLIFLILVTLIIARIKGFYANAAETNCSDPTTEGTFSFLGETLTSAYKSNILTGVMDGLQLLFGLYTLYSFFRGEDEEEKAEEAKKFDEEAPEEHATENPMG